MENFSIPLIIRSIKKLLGEGPHFLHEPSMGKKETNYVTETIKNNYVSTKGIYVQKFEKKIKNYTKANHVTSTINGTQAIFIALKALGIKQNEEVLVPALTFVGTVNAISYLGAEPHFIDSNIKDFGIDCRKLENYLKKIVIFKKNKSINKKTGRAIRAIIPVHVFGHPCDIEFILRLAKKYKLKIVEDAAECLGSFYKNKHLGTFGDFGILSFNGNKIITSAGGGAVLVNSKKNFDFISLIGNVAKSNHPIELYNVDIGYNYKMPNFNASLGFSQFNKINKFLKYKKNLNRIYFKRFSKFNNKLKLIRDLKNTKSNFWLQGIIVNKISLRNAIIKTCIKNKIFIKPIWKPLHENKYCKKKYCHKDLSNTKYLAKRLISLPSGFGILKNEKK